MIIEKPSIHDTNEDILETYKEWRRIAANAVAEWSLLQKQAEQKKDYQLARFYGDCKRDAVQWEKKTDSWVREFLY